MEKQVKIDIFSGFLGAGKTTLLKKMLSECYKNEKVVVVENEFGKVGIDGDILQNTDVQVKEVVGGCICCSLAGNLHMAFTQLIKDYSPDRILIEPSGVSVLSDVMELINRFSKAMPIVINASITVVDAKQVKAFLPVFSDFYTNQMKNANCVILSRVEEVDDEKLRFAIDTITKQKKNVNLITTPWDKLSGSDILHAMETPHTLDKEIKEEIEQLSNHHHHCTDEHCGCHNHNHNHKHGHEHSHNHSDDMVKSHSDFKTWGIQTPKKTTKESLEKALNKLDSGDYGFIVRAKGIVDGGEEWIAFDYVPQELHVCNSKPMPIGKMILIGANIKVEKIEKLFDDCFIGGLK